MLSKLRINYMQLIKLLLKLINNSSSLNKQNHDYGGFWISDLNNYYSSIEFYDFYFHFLLRFSFDREDILRWILLKVRAIRAKIIY